MHHVDFKLAQTCLGNGGVRGNVHGLAGVVEFGKELIERIQLAHCQGLGSGAAFARAGRGRHTQDAATVIDQVKF